MFFPWLGADDAYGSQIGMVSVPLMDHMQNLTVDYTFLLGTTSLFPAQNLGVTWTRWQPTWNLSAYRAQSYNGRFVSRSTGNIFSSFLDEKGTQLSVAYNTYTSFATWAMTAGIKSSEFDLYIGPAAQNDVGTENTLFSSLSMSKSYSNISWAVGTNNKVAPDYINPRLDYNQVGGSASLAFFAPTGTKLSFGVDSSRTRGEAQRSLKEFYLPLKTFLPGSGGGLNQNSFSLTPYGSLFSPRFGDTQGRIRANFTTPIIEDLAIHRWILYFERLDFSAFYNYGGAWFGAEPKFGWDKLIAAHGYNVDLQMENKGVRANVGIGLGRVVHDDLQLYLKTGFDALF